MDQYIDPYIAGLVAGIVAWLRRPGRPGSPQAWLASRLDGPAVPALAVALAVGLSWLLGGDLRAAVVRGVASGAAAIGGVSLLGYGAGKMGSSLGGPVIVEALEIDASPIEPAAPTPRTAAPLPPPSVSNR